MIWHRKLHILFFGYGSQAKKIKKCCDKFFKLSENIKFTGIKQNYVIEDIPIVTSLENAQLLYGDIDCVFIASPNSSHLSNFKECLEKKIPFIYVEKPALGIQEYFEKKRNHDFDFIKYIQIGYHFNYIDPIIKLKKSIKEGIYGELIRLDLFLGHGLVYKNDFKNSWRSENKYTLIETVLSHLINLSFGFGDYDNSCNLNINQRYNQEKNLYDSINVNYCLNEQSSVNLTASWGSPLERNFKAYFSNAIWEYDFKKLTVKYPRDVFTKDGYFKEPSKKIYIDRLSGIESSIEYFLNKVKENICFQNQFNNSSNTSKLIQNIINKIF